MRLFALCAAVSLCAVGQETRGTIFGRITDPSAAPLPNAAVLVTNAETSVSTRLATNESGYYEANLLLPGMYRVSAESTGFRKFEQSGVQLTVGGRAEVNIRMQLGDVTESVSVTAESPMIDTSQVASGRMFENRSLMELPVLGNNVILLAKMSTGIQHGTGTNNYVGLHSNPTANSKGGAAGNVGGNEWTIDGMPNMGSDRKTAYMPYSDTVQEFRVETSLFDASQGHSTGASFTMISKSGTNSIHGTATEQHWQQRWNGTPFFVKQLYYRRIAEAEARGNSALASDLRRQDKQPSGHSHNWAGTIGGPVVLPKIYNGKDKTFFFFSYNGFKDSKTEDASAINRTLPTLANRQGDFSNLLAVDPVRYQIHDPLTTRPDPARPGHFIRDPFPGNIIPASRIANPAYQAYLKMLPIPNNDPLNARAEPVNNFLAVSTPYFWDYKAFTNRMDHTISDRHRVFGRWSWNDFLEDRSDWTYSTVRGLQTNGLNRHNVGGSANYTWTINPNTIFDVGVALNEFREGDKITVPLQFKASDVGLPGYLDQKAGEQTILPYMTFSGYESLSRSGVPAFTRFRVGSSRGDITHIRGQHTLKGGLDMRHYYRTGGGGGNTSGNFTFDNQFTRRNEDTFTPAGNLGLSWAAFMLGLPSSATVATNDTYALHSPAYGGYLQDSWRVSPKLTINAGFRIEYENGPTERYNRMLGPFDPTASLPISTGAAAAYAAAPIPELAASQFGVAGGSTYAGTGGRSRHLWGSEWMFMPRASVAYQWNSSTVVRAGYGMFYDTLNVMNNAATQTGFSRNTATNMTDDFGQTWRAGDPANGVSPLVDPFPVRSNGTRFDTPTRDALGVMAVVGRSASFVDPNITHARQQRYRVSIQHQFAGNFMIDVAYAGSWADRVNIARNANALPEQYWAKGMVRNNEIANNLTANVASPFRLANFAALQSSAPLIYQDMSTLGFYTSPTIRKDRLLRPYPHLSGLTQDLAPAGKVRTDALEISVEKRFSAGFNMSAGYTKLRDRSAIQYLNEYDPEPTWMEGQFGRPHRFFGSGVYDLPVGKGKLIARSGIWNMVFGGFRLAATYEWQPGPLLSFNNLFYYGDLADISKGERTLDRWFNTDNFERNPARVPASFHSRVFPLRVPGLRADGLSQWNTNITKDIRVRERVTLQLRLDAINLQNRTQFAAPDTNPLSANFGRVTSQTDNTPRFIQIQARLRF